MNISSAIRTFLVAPGAAVTTGQGAAAFDKRRWLSFLTWAFVLAEMAGRDGFLSTGAHAGNDDAARPEAPLPDHHGTAVNPIPLSDSSSGAEGPPPIEYQHAATMPAFTAGDAPSELAAAQAVPVGAADASSMGGGGGGGGGGGSSAGDGDATSHGASDDVAADGAHIGVDLGIAELNSLPLDVDGKLAGIGLHFDLGDTIHSLVDGTGLAHLPIVGGVMEDVGGVVGPTVGNLLSVASPVVSLIGVGNDGHAPDANFGLPGQLVFGNGSGASAQGDDLATPSGNYTNYGISLSTGTSGGSAGTAHGSSSGTSDADNIDAHVAQNLPGSEVHVSSDADHHDQVLLRTSADVLV